MKDFNAALPTVLSAIGLILDLRENPGGNSAHGYAIAAHFTTAPLKSSTYLTREHVGVYKAFGRLPDVVSGILSRPMNPMLKEVPAPYPAYGKMNALRDGEPDIVESAKDGIVKGPTVVLVGPDTALKPQCRRASESPTANTCVM